MREKRKEKKERKYTEVNNYATLVCPGYLSWIESQNINFETAIVNNFAGTNIKMIAARKHCGRSCSFLIDVIYVNSDGCLWRV